ncbi:MAG: hypothetical protein J6R80_00450, partial [Kiritimatiellae bacterium]|nr:hypothetical protein [Kiritimatiellia bacterium]
MHKTLIQTLLAGFYAILAASPLGGGGVMIAARQIAFGGGRKNYTAADYVHDGLVAMWDAKDTSLNNLNIAINTANFVIDDFGARNVSGKLQTLIDSTSVGFGNLLDAYRSNEFTCEYVMDFSKPDASNNSSFIRLNPAPYGLWISRQTSSTIMQDASITGSRVSVSPSEEMF